MATDPINPMNSSISETALIFPIVRLPVVAITNDRIQVSATEPPRGADYCRARFYLIFQISAPRFLPTITSFLRQPFAVNLDSLDSSIPLSSPSRDSSSSENISLGFLRISGVDSSSLLALVTHLLHSTPSQLLSERGRFWGSSLLLRGKFDKALDLFMWCQIQEALGFRL